MNDNGNVIQFRGDSQVTPDPHAAPAGAELDRAVEIVDAELVDGPDNTSAGPEPPGRGQRERRPVLAPWLRDRAQFVATVRWAVAHAGHVVAFHTVRLPLYAGRLLGT